MAYRNDLGKLSISSVDQRSDERRTRPMVEREDFDREIIAARGFDLVIDDWGEVLLASPRIRDSPWYPRKIFQAKCIPPLRRVATHRGAPDSTCTCGVFGRVSGKVTERTIPGSILGSAWFWGRYLKHEDGVIRSEFCYPRSLELMFCSQCSRGRPLAEGFAIRRDGTDAVGASASGFTPLEVRCVDCVQWSRQSRIRLKPTSRLVADLAWKYELSNEQGGIE